MSNSIKKGVNYAYTLFANQSFIDVNIVQSGWQCCDKSHTFGSNTRVHHLFHFVIKGKGILYSLNDKGIEAVYNITAGQGFYIAPYQRNMYIADDKDPWVYAWVEFDGLKIPEILSIAGLDSNNPIYTSNNTSINSIVEQEIIYLAKNGDKPILTILGHFYLLLDALQQGSVKKRTPTKGNLKKFYVQESITFIENNYFAEITIKDMANFCNLNHSYFGKIFHDVTKTTPQKFLIGYRMSKACEMLIATDKLISTISEEVGYPEPLSFSRAFKSIYNVSPREWRLANQTK
ncbi:MAG: AraC family transcriptional regulator [Lachnospirales bacterium]